MAPDVERFVKSTPKPKLLTMDVIELTSLLKAIGFRLESIDYDELRDWSNHKKSGENGMGTGGAAVNSGRTDADQHNYIHVEISCSKSKIVSNLSLKFHDNEASASDVQTTTTAAAATTSTSPSKSIACSCPKRETRNSNNSFWEVQSIGTFSNQRRSINALINPESGIDHDTSSNLLPVLSAKSIALTHVLTQVLLNQYKIGESSTAKDVDIKGIVRSLETVNTIPSTPVDELNLITPVSSMNVTPTSEQEAATAAALMNVTMPPKVMVNDDQTTALNETVNTEAFGSPKSDLFTSSPNGNNDTMGLNNERDVNVINHLNMARQSIEQALLTMKLNVTRCLTQDVAAAASAGLLSTTTQELPPNNGNRNRTAAPQLPRMLNGRNASQVAANNARTSTVSTLNRRASLGSVSLSRGATVKSAASPALTARLNTSRPNSVDRPASAASKLSASKLSIVRRAVTGISNRALGSITSSASKTPTQATASVKRTSIGARQTASPATNGGTPTTRKTAATSRIALSSSSKIVKK